MLRSSSPALSPARSSSSLPCRLWLDEAGEREASPFRSPHCSSVVVVAGVTSPSQPHVLLDVLVLAVLPLPPLALVVVIVVAVVVVVGAAEEDDAGGAARPTRRSTKAPTMSAWLCLPLIRRYHTRSSSSASQPRSPCAATISSMDARKSPYGSSESTATATLSSTSDVDAIGSDCGFSSASSACAADCFPGDSAKMELDAGPGGSTKKRSVDVRPRLRITASDHSSDAVVVEKPSSSSSSSTPCPSSSSSSSKQEPSAEM
uniref:Uncharacterized protein n=1 Tax=Triticum urartu TaxID=4572 RepID=A0A8R7U6A3_TRIUA